MCPLRLVRLKGSFSMIFKYCAREYGEVNKLTDFIVKQDREATRVHGPEA